MDGINLKGLIKNTFIDVPVADSGSASKRSSSTPASFRSLQKCAEPIEFFQGTAHTDTSTDASAEDVSPSDSVFGIDTDDEGSIDTNGGNYDSHCEVPPPPVDENPLATATRLSSKAKPWQPQPQAMFIRDPLPYEFGRQAAHVVTVAKEALESSGYVQNVDVVNEANAWGISIKMKDASLSEQAFSIAKDALLEGAANSTCTYVLGYLAKPFQVQKHGFSTVLCGMRDESRACWDAYSKGFCRKPERCKLLHPCCMMRVSVSLRA